MSVLAAIALVVMGFVFAGQSAGAAVDIGVREELRQLGSTWRQLALAVDWLAEPVGAVVVLGTCVLLFLRARNRFAAVLVVVAPAAVVVVTTGMKPLTGRTINDGFLAFPSGHTAFLAAVALVVTLSVARRLVVVMVVTLAAGLAMAWAQVLLNAHYPTDTLGGFCVTLAVVPVVVLALDRIWTVASRAAPAAADDRPDGNPLPARGGAPAVPPSPSATHD
ncbi:phosphatase PAP2 family protein [Actinophytocola algeriensis]|uniref:Undecaprenyl-diphosphatase n=1 Tax=Actinophytocola algeriensis TaxID=1768010 RepID=A0A7W7Q3B5_9PSEU|nr:phosphatase PAP2 family protein [Actinophytocola algeriensis]MBB4906287.1 undecaprenyl-diphosphatase [Actinophytocola algeriensis]MBE1477768.1 undecaprenyl-diphosphatase [Actinophytocola algeriensis]